MTVTHLSRTELLSLLGQRKGSWRSHSERLRAQANVKRHGEHLLDFSAHAKTSRAELRSLVTALFEKD